MSNIVQISGPYSVDTGSWPPDAWKEDRMRKEANRPPRVVWETGLVLAVPLVGAALVELVLHSFGIH